MHWGQVATSLLHVLAVKSHPTPEYAWEGVELALSSINAIEHLSLPYDPASRRLFGVPVVATVSEAAGVGHVLAADAVVVDTDTIGVGVQWSETSNTDDFAKNLIRARCEGRFGTSVLVSARRGELRSDGIAGERSMSVSCGCDATFAGMAGCHCLKCHLSFADRPAYDAHRRLARPFLHPTLLGMELLDDRGWGWAARDTA